MANAITVDNLPANGIAQVQLANVPSTGFVSATASGPGGTSECGPCPNYSFNDILLMSGFE